MTENNKTSYLLIINDGLYGNERPYNALRLAMMLGVKRLAYRSVFNLSSCLLYQAFTFLRENVKR
jgi:sulfur relay (sulfurtransferase) complex TusBCD TusD component (DsrE family)